MGTSPLQAPLVKQAISEYPTSEYPVLQVNITVVPIVLLSDVIAPLAGAVMDGQVVNVASVKKINFGRWLFTLVNHMI